MIDVDTSFSIYVDQLGKVYITKPQAIKIWRHGYKQYQKGYFSSWLSYKDKYGRNVSVQRFIPLETYQLLEGQKKIQEA